MEKNFAQIRVHKRRPINLTNNASNYFQLIIICAKEDYLKVGFFEHFVCFLFFISAARKISVRTKVLHQLHCQYY